MQFHNTKQVDVPQQQHELQARRQVLWWISVSIVDPISRWINKERCIRNKQNEQRFLSLFLCLPWLYVTTMVDPMMVVVISF